MISFVVEFQEVPLPFPTCRERGCSRVMVAESTSAGMAPGHRNACESSNPKALQIRERLAETSIEPTKRSTACLHRFDHSTQGRWDRGSPNRGARW